MKEAILLRKTCMWKKEETTCRRKELAE